MTNKIRLDLENAVPDVAEHFEMEPWTANVRMLKDDFDIKHLKSPTHYLDTISELNEMLREARAVFLYSVFQIVRKDEGVPYPFKSPFVSAQEYSAVMRNDNEFFLLDEDGAYREVFTNEKFVQVVESQFREIIKNT